jgi:hypothetical protein
MDIEVEVISSSFDVSFDLSQTIDVDTNVAATRLEDLINFDGSNKNDQYVIMYNSSTQKYELVNPDKVLSSAAVDEPIQPGLPNDFVDELDVDLDDRIDLDAGNF